MTKKKSKIKSKCCKAKVRYSDLSPDFIGDTNISIGTCVCICTKCNKPCDIYIPIRKVWKKSPATQVQGDKREKRKRLFTDKEIREFLKNEDF